MRATLTKDERDRYYIASVTDDYEITTVCRYIYPEDFAWQRDASHPERVIEHIFESLRHTMTQFRESCEKRGYAGLLGVYSEDAIKEATRRDDWENIVGIKHRPKTLAEVHEGCMDYNEESV